MKLNLLNKDTAIQKAKKFGLFDKNSDVHAVDILKEVDETEGLVNQIFLLFDPTRSVVLKQVLPFSLAISKYLGELHEIDPERIRLESRALTFFESFYHIAPKVYKVSKKDGLIFMEDLTGLNNLRYELSLGKIFPDFGIRIGRFLADLRYYTSELYLDSESKKRQDAYFENTDLRAKLTDMITGEDNAFHHLDSFLPEVRALQSRLLDDPKIINSIRELNQKLKANAECLCHMDLHTGNVLVSSGEIKILDSEFSGNGSTFMDLGRISSSFLINYLSWLAREDVDLQKRQLMQAYDLQMVHDLYEAFKLRLKEHVPDLYESLYKEIFQDSIRLMALSVILRLQSGIALSHDISLVKSHRRLAQIQKLAFEFLEAVFYEDFNEIQDVIDWVCTHA